MGEVIVVTTPEIPGCEIVKVLGPVHGLNCANKSVGGKLVVGIKGFGGEVTSYTFECEKARMESLNRLIENVRKMGANAVIGADLETSDIIQGKATVFAVYGTAVVAKPAEKKE